MLSPCYTSRTSHNTVFWPSPGLPRHHYSSQQTYKHKERPVWRAARAAQSQQLSLEQYSMGTPVANRDPERPIFHVAPLHGGWMNDPNGPIMYRGRYHLYVHGHGFAMGLVARCKHGCASCLPF